MEPTLRQRFVDLCVRWGVATDAFSWTCAVAIVGSMSLIVWLKS